MDRSQDRASTNPRLSRLPVPRPISVSGIPKPTPSVTTPTSLRPKPSRDSISGSAAGASELQNPKLRASASRSQLRSSTSNGNGRAPPLRASASRDHIRSSSIRASATKPATTAPKPTRAVSASQRRWSTITNTPSTQYKPWAEPPESDRHALRRVSTPEEDASNALLHSYLNGSERISEDCDDNDDTLIHSPDRASATEPSKFRSKKPRPSLSERTMETLAQIPSSPAMSKKSSLFFDHGRPKSRAESSNSRPGSSYNSDGSARPSSRQTSRPPSSAGPDEAVFPGTRGTANNGFKRPLSVIQGTPSKTHGAGSNAPKLRPSASRASLASSKLSASMTSLPDVRSPSPDKKPLGRTPAKPPAKTASAKTLKPKASANGLLKKPSMSTLSANGDSEPPSPSAASWDGTIQPIAPAIRQSIADTPALSPRKSSAALRDHIAKAKAAKRAAMKASGNPALSTDDVTIIVPSDNGFNFDAANTDPFNLSRGEDSKGKVLKQRVGAGRTTGKLNIAALGLKEIPSEVMNMYDFESIGASGSWAESVELTRFIAADNELEILDDAVFPDRSIENFEQDEDSRGNMFGGLETLDLHGNKLIGVPMGFRRLAHLSSLNLSSNCLENDCLDIIAQMTALRDLKLANNRLTGPLNSSLSNLAALEMLDIHGNKVTALPPDVESMSRLRILNLSENSFESLSFDGIAKLPLTELDLKRNKLSGTLIEDPIRSLPVLQTLDVSANKLTRLVPPDALISLPVVHTLSLSMNRLQELPDMTTWTNLLTLAADTNNIATIPNSFTSLEKIRQADFSSNDIRMVPPEIARMDNLTMLRLTGNPLRDKKFASASTDEIKEVLAGRLEPPPPYQEQNDQSMITDMMNHLDVNKKHNAQELDNRDTDSRSDLDDDFATPPTSAPHSPVRSRAQTLTNEIWQVKSGGLLDRSRTESSSLDPSVCSAVAARHQVKQAQLHHNLFSCLPSSLSFFAGTLTSLAVGHNQMVGETYLAEDLELPVLTELNLTSNHITSLGPLTKFLRAPALEKIDISLNRLSALPPDLKQTFPKMTVLLASNNHLTELDPASIKGLKIVDVSSNDIAHLDPRIGLLGGRDGLERLEVAGNRFRVPRWNVLERGTEATMRWLRGRVPAADMAAWKAENGDDGSDELD